MFKTRSYKLPPTALMPNSPLPLVHYIGLLKNEDERTPCHVYDLFRRNGWEMQWLFRYGHTQRAHYHSAAHEAMAVLTGTATIRFGVADTEPDMHENTYGDAKEAGGIELQATAGDVFIIPAGVSHKTFDALPAGEFKLLSPGTGHELDKGDMREAFHEIELSGFTMLGAYPLGCSWDFLEGGEDKDNFEKILNLPRPGTDPVLGKSEAGIIGLWK